MATAVVDDITKEITALERKLARATERGNETAAELRRYLEDAELGLVKKNVDRVAFLEQTVREDEALVEKLTLELNAKRREPEERRKKEARGAELKAKAEALDKKIAAWAESGKPLLEEAKTLADTIIAEFCEPNLPWARLMAPFRGTNLVLRLRFWTGHDFSFLDRLEAFKREKRA